MNQKSKEKNQKNSNRIYINTLTPNFKHKNNKGENLSPKKGVLI